MKITFIYPDLSSDYNSYQFGIAAVSALLKKEGHTVSLIHIIKPPGRDEFKELIKTHDADLYGFSSTTNMFGYVKQWAPLVKEAKNALTACGGVHATLAPQEPMSVDAVDIVFRGESEISFLELSRRLEEGRDFTDIKGLWTKRGKNCVKNPPNLLVEDLDRLPFPDREIFNYETLAHSKKGIGLFMASRGCPYSCYYCCNHSLRNLYGEARSGRYLRFHSVDYCIREIKYVLSRYPHIKIVHFTDDVLPANRAWFAEFVGRYKEEISLPFQCNVFPLLADGEVIELLKEAGCYELGMGVESGSERIRRKALNRPVSDEKILEGFRMAKKAGLRAYTYNMVGIPGEDIQEMLSTVKINARIRPNTHQVSIFYPYPLTKLHDISRENSLLTGLDSTNYYQDTVLGFSPQRKAEIVFVKIYFKELVALYRLTARVPVLERVLDGLLLSRFFPFYFFIKAEPVIHLRRRCVSFIERNTPALFGILYRVKKSIG
jgi:radical SAM superfamily enzyme YgiQ (UPF0313 family)